MDPDATLRNVRTAARAVLAGDGADATTAVELAEALSSLDDWLSKGGFLPVDWSR